MANGSLNRTKTNPRSTQKNKLFWYLKQRTRYCWRLILMFEDFNCKPECSISFWNTKITLHYTLFRMPCVFKQHSKCELIKFYSPYLYPGPSLFGFSSLSIPKSPTKRNEKWSPICSPLLRALYSLSSSSAWSASLTVMTASTYKRLWRFNQVPINSPSAAHFSKIDIM